MRQRKMPRRALPAAVAAACLVATGAVAQTAAPVTALPPVTVTAALPNQLEAVPGSSVVVGSRQLEAERPYSIREALQGVPGLHVVGEDAFGLNLNIGVRGLDPRRTSRTLLLEDGMPIHLAPYSDPTAHYHTPLERLSRIEVIKGSGQIVHGPQTVGGVINFVTRAVPRAFEGSVDLSVGDRAFGRAAASVGSGGAWGGWLAEAAMRRGNGSRDGSHHRIRDVSLKTEFDLGTQQSLRLRFGYYDEDSRFGEAGLDQARFDTDPFQNAFRNDVFELERRSLQAVHTFNFSDTSRLATQVYYQKVERASYRQLDAIVEADADGVEAEKEREGLRYDEVGADGSGIVAGCPVDVDYSVPGGFEQFASVCGNQMRPRTYEFYGIEPRLELQHGLFGLRSELVVGLRLHKETINRKRYNGAFATAREDSPGTGLRDEFDIETEAVAAYVQNTFHAGHWSFTPGLRYENYRQKNRITQDEFAPVSPPAETAQRHTELLPGLGVTWFGWPGTTLFAGVHRGIAPPRPDANLPPGDADLQKVDPEISTNIEIGARSAPATGVQVEATLFQIDFKNQILPGYAVGQGQTFANAGRSLNRGVELGARVDFGRLQGRTNNPYLSLSYTNLFTARFDSDLLTPDFAPGEDETTVFSNARGKRLPYAPRQTVSASLGYEHGSLWDARIGVSHVGEQYTDALNTREAAADGQSGLIPSYTTLNASVNLRLPQQGATLYLSATNLTDKTYLVSRVNGAFAGAPRQVFVGARVRF
ncbi:TonB-dependent receptor [uncultured Methylibium sp.]|uniref:TonB-dependent receptor family protein n=1 Tax=uncultured Methylibium sp. TaxID=381093 RepID=UPI0025CC46D9|nr:TonB-dependent receptor [uncultured Methylibium sp.]